MSNPYTRICFRLGDQDARRLSEGFSFFEPKDLQNLGIGEAICRIERAEYDFNLKTSPLPEVDVDLADESREQLIALSRKKYGTPKAEVEALIARQWQPVETELPPETKIKIPLEVKELPAEPDIVKRERPPRQKPKPIPAEPPPLGKGGRQHKYLQEMVKRLAQDKGFMATIEKPVTRSKLRRISRYSEYFDSPAARASWATSTSVGWLAYVYASAGM